jgi:predicted nucleic acid-binding protein
VPELPTATIDTSVLLSLEAAGLLGALSVLFGRVLVPSKVREELKEGAEKSSVALNAIADLAFYENCDDFSPDLVEQLLLSKSRMDGRDRGEAEAVIQGAERSVTMVLLDDQQARKWAARHRLDAHGTVWLCAELRKTGYLAALRPYYVALLEGGRRQPLPAMNAYLVKFSEDPISKEDAHLLKSAPRKESRPE